MKKTLKTYAVYGLLEWHAQLPSGKAVLNVDFTGGTQTGYGVTPALYSTDNLVKQCIIENSIQFKRGKIKLYNVTELDVAETDYEPGNDVAAVPGADGAPENEDNGGAQENNEPAADGTTVEPEEEKTLVDEVTPVVDETKEVEVTDFDDAKTYLNQEFGIPVRNLRSHDAILKEAAAKGIRFKGL